MFPAYFFGDKIPKNYAKLKRGRIEGKVRNKKQTEPILRLGASRPEVKRRNGWRKWKYSRGRGRRREGTRRGKDQVKIGQEGREGSKGGKRRGMEKVEGKEGQERRRRKRKEGSRSVRGGEKELFTMHM